MNTDELGLAGDKQAIRHAFDRAAHSYDQHAALQRDVGQRLLDTLPRDLSDKVVIDLGCGTGYFAQQLLARGAHVIAVDLSPQMLAQARARCGDERIEYLCMDACALQLGECCADYLFSSLALQWCANLSRPLGEMRRVVKPDGRIVFSTLLAGSLYELSNAWAKVDRYQHVNQFHSLIQVKIALAQANCERYHLNLPSIRVWYPSALGVMRDLKGIGASHVAGRTRGLTNRQSFIRVEQAYQEFKNDEGLVPATYHVCLGVINR